MSREKVIEAAREHCIWSKQNCIYNPAEHFIRGIDWAYNRPPFKVDDIIGLVESIRNDDMVKFRTHICRIANGFRDLGDEMDASRIEKLLNL